MGEAATSAPSGSHFPENTRLRRHVFRFLGASQLVWAKLEQTAARAALLRQQNPDVSPAGEAVFDQCEQKLEMARKCLERTFRRSFSFWDLVHQIDELLLLVTPREMLATEALDLLAKFERKVQDPASRNAWLGEDAELGPLRQVVARMKQGTAGDSSTPPEQELAQLQQDREILRGAMHLLNEQGDKYFWTLGTNVSVQILSAVMLVSLFASAFLWGRMLLPGFSGSPMGSAMAILFGAAGAIISNMLWKKPFVTSIGPTARYFVYYLFAKPVVGAFTALFIYLLGRSQLLFEILVEGSRSAGAHAAVQIVVGTAAAADFAGAAIAVAAGFSGDRLLSAVVDQVLGRISSKAEKEKAAEGP